MSNLKNEIKSSIFNLYFIVACALTTFLAVYYTYEEIDTYLEYCKHVDFNVVLSRNTLSPTISAYTLWLGGPKLEDLKSCQMFFKVAMFLSVVPFTWSYCTDRREAKKSKNAFYPDLGYRLNKYIAVFISSGSIVAIPLIINLLCSFWFIPAVTPDPVYDIYFREFSSGIFGDVFYSFPIIYELLYILIFFSFCGLLGCIGYAFSLIIKHEIVAVISPVIILIITYFLNSKIHIGYEMFSPISYMNVADVMLRNYKTMFIEMLVMLLFSFFVIFIPSSKKKSKPINNIAENKT